MKSDKILQWLLPAIVFGAVSTATATDVVGGDVFVGVLRPDGLLVPIAIHDDSGWTNPWPLSHESDESVRSLPIPLTLQDIPADWLPGQTTLPIDWRVLLKSGKRTSVRLVRPMRPKDFIDLSFMGILTDYRVNPSRAGREDDNEELGVVVAGDAELGTFAPASARQARALTAAIRPLVDHAELDGIRDEIRQKQSQSDWDGKPIVFPANEPQRAATRLDIGFSQSTRVDQGRTYFRFYGSKTYGAKPIPPGAASLGHNCEAMVEFSGVLVRERNGTIHVPRIAADATLDCKNEEALAEAEVQREVELTLATLHLHGEVFLVSKIVVEDGFSYCIIDLSNDNGCVPMKGDWQLRDHSKKDR